MFMRLAFPTGLFARSASIGFAAAFALHLHHAPAMAQGSAGGNIGKQDKSVSGDQESPRSRSEPAPRTPARSGGGGGGGNHDGLWNASSFGQTCSVNITGVVTISNGRMTADGLSGSVSGGGSVTAFWSALHLSATFSGRISGRKGSGRFQRNDGCVGRWTMVKQ